MKRAPASDMVTFSELHEPPMARTFCWMDAFFEAVMLNGVDVGYDEVRQCLDRELYLHTEFSGFGTPEWSLACLANYLQGHHGNQGVQLKYVVASQGDYAPSCRHALSHVTAIVDESNVSKTCRFGDILNLLSATDRQHLTTGVREIIRITRAEIRFAAHVSDSPSATGSLLSDTDDSASPDTDDSSSDSDSDTSKSPSTSASSPCTPAPVVADPRDVKFADDQIKKMFKLKTLELKNPIGRACKSWTLLGKDGESTPEDALAALVEICVSPDENAYGLFMFSRRKTIDEIISYVTSNNVTLNNEDWCYAHCKQCTRIPSRLATSASEQTPKQILVAGHPCVDWSSFGSQLEGGGPTALATAVLLFMILVSNIDCGVLECTPRFPVQVYITLLGRIFDVRLAA